MANGLGTFGYYLTFPFVRYAIIVGTLISLSASLLGVTLVLKRYSFIGDGLSHVAFGAVAVASVFSLTNNMLLVFPITIISAVLLLKSGNNAKVKGDAAIAMLSVGALAVGYILLHIFSTSANVSGDVCSTLFGSTSILTLTIKDVWIALALFVLVLLLFVFLYTRIFAVTFDETFAKASGLKTDRYNLLIAIVVAVIIVIGMRLVGSLLISALIVFPAMTSMRIMNTFKSVVITSAIIATASALLGTALSIVASTPVGATIVVMDIFFFILFSLIGYLQRK